MRVDVAKESVFQNAIIEQMLAQGWVLGEAARYNRETALYEEDVLAFVKNTQPKEWQKFQEIYTKDTERHFIQTLVKQLAHVDSSLDDASMRKFGTLGVLRHGFKSRNTDFFLCQLPPENNLNPDLQAFYQANIFRLVPELVYSPYATQKELATTGKQAKKWRIDLVLFVNGLPVVTMELKSEFKQAVDLAIKQYQKTRLPKDPETNKPEPLLTFKRGALVHFAVSQYEAYMTTQLAGKDTFFLPFNKGTHDGNKGNDVSEDIERYATDYLWNEVLTPENLLIVLGRFMHLHIEHKEDDKGVKYKKEGTQIHIYTKTYDHGVQLIVEDTGVGIPQEEIPRIFEKGFTGTNGRMGGRSTGMGLYLCSRLCEKLGIEIRAESECGEETRMILTFPVSAYLLK